MFAATRFDEHSPQFSPDGKWLAFVSDLSGQFEVYVHEVGSDRRHQVSTNGSDFVLWTANGRELIFPTDEGPVAVSFLPGPTPGIGKPALLYTWKSVAADNMVGFAGVPDGQRFATLYNNPLPPLTEIRVVTNWLQGLARVR